MSNTITDSGIKIKTLAEIIKDIIDGTENEPGLTRIYDEEINIDPDTPDGQLVNIFALAVKDALDLIVQTYNSFDPDFAVGRTLDMRCAINGIKRRGASFTQTYVQVKTNRALTIPGLDNPNYSPFTISDAEGNRFVLKTTKVFTGPTDPDSDDGMLDFRAEEPGPVIVLPNTLTKIVTFALGLETVNNPSPPYTIGTDEETDFDLRVRRSRALAMPAIGSTDGILSSILDVDDVREAVVYENTTSKDETGENGIPGHSIWCIVAGGKEEDVASAIYLKRNAGCGMKGKTEVEVTQENGTGFKVYFDRPKEQPLWIKFRTATTDSGELTAAEQEYLREQLVQRLSHTVYQNADITTITKTAREILPNVVIYEVGVSTDNDRPLDEKDWSPFVTPASKRNQFVINGSRIAIDGKVGSDDSIQGEPGNENTNE